MRRRIKRYIRRIVRVVSEILERVRRQVRYWERFRDVLLPYVLSCGFSREECGYGSVPRHWKVVRLGDKFEVKWGRGCVEWGGEYPVVGDGIRGYTHKPLTQGPTIVIPRKTDKRDPIYVDRACYPTDANFYLERRDDEISWEFLYYFMRTFKVSSYCVKSVVPNLRKGEVEGYIVFVPPADEQELIVRLARLVDEKIELLKRKGVVLERILRVLKGDVRKVVSEVEDEWLRAGVGREEEPKYPANTKDAAKRLANYTFMLREELLKEVGRGEGVVKELIDEFSRHLGRVVGGEEFADQCAQTVAYGLFVVKALGVDVERWEVVEFMQDTSPVLGKIFRTFLIDGVGRNIGIIVDEMLEFIKEAQIEAYKNENKNLIFDFYETFLDTYDKHLRRRRGVYYTPLPIVKFIVEAVNDVLKDELGVARGLGGEEIEVLDPATGTLTFIVEAVRKAWEEYGRGDVKRFVEELVFKNFSAVEIMITPFLMAELRMRMFLKELGYDGKFGFDLRLANALEGPMDDIQRTLIGEGRTGIRMMRKGSVAVIIGNPPYTALATRTKFIEKVMNLYRDDPDIKVKTAISNDCVRFIRLAHWIVEQQGKGVVAFVISNSILRSYSYKKVREELVKFFDKIYIIDLNGDRRRANRYDFEDENVFGIMQGIAIMILVKNGKRKGVFYKNIRGSREYKFNLLLNSRVKTIDWKKIDAKPPMHYLFEIDTEKHKDTYARFVSLRNLFKEYGSVVKTGNDSKYIGFTVEELANKNGILPNDPRIQHVTKKPFDNRFILYDKEKLDRHAFRIAKNFFIEGEKLSKLDNLAIVTQMNTFTPGNAIAFVVDRISVISYSMSSYVFPLFIYEDKLNRKSNIDEDFIRKYSSILKTTVDPKDIFYYIYSMMYCRKYLQKYKSQIFSDFPRIPFTKDVDLFVKLSGLGRRLVDLHLLRDVGEVTVALSEGSGVVQHVGYWDGVVYINRQQKLYDTNGVIEKEVWNYTIELNRFCKIWLKNRRGRVLTDEDVRVFGMMINAVRETIKIQNEIDRLYDDVERSVVDFSGGWACEGALFQAT